VGTVRLLGHFSSFEFSLLPIIVHAHPSAMLLPPGVLRERTQSVSVIVVNKSDFRSHVNFGSLYACPELVEGFYYVLLTFYFLFAVLAFFTAFLATAFLFGAAAFLTAFLGAYFKATVATPLTKQKLQ
jgi:hypothetical protein